MNNVHTPRYDVGSRARLVCISRRGRSTGLFPITGTARRQRYRAIGLSGYRARLALAGERKTIARWQGDGDVGDTPPSHRSPLCIRFRSCRLSSTLVHRCRSRHFALSVLHELALEIDLSDRPVVNRVVESEMCRELKTTWLTYFRSLEFSPPPPSPPFAVYSTWFSPSLGDIRKNSLRVALRQRYLCDERISDPGWNKIIYNISYRFSYILLRTNFSEQFNYFMKKIVLLSLRLE